MTDSESAERRERLGQSAGAPGAAPYNPGYSLLIRRLRLVLPLAALAIAAVVFTWGSMSETRIIPAIEDTALPKILGKNELLNPRFESTDEKNQPYTITAERAVQGEANDNLIILEKPVGDMLLSSGNRVALKADNGAFRQDTQRLFLRGHVRMLHDAGYEMETAQLQVDLAKSTAWSEDPVSGRGPAGTLEATGLQASTPDGHLIFNGPAKLVLNRRTQAKAEGL